MDNVLIIFAKYPTPGLVKTRLAKDIGKTKATRLYKYLAEAAIERTKSIHYKQIIFYTPYGKRQAFRSWLGKDIKFSLQRGKDLGQRMKNAFIKAFKKERAKKVIAIGTDSPIVNEKIILNSFQKLDKYKSVIGPSVDGGYYLLGLSSCYSSLFNGIKWSTKEVFDQTITKIRKISIPYAILPKSFDIDRKNDLNLLKKHKISSSLQRR